MMRKKFKFKKNIHDFTIKRFIPNMITLAALCIGLSAVKFTLVGQLNYAILSLLFAAVLDATDGRIARYMGVTSHFGAELDSLADFVNFGVAPAIIAYLISLKNLGELGWGIVLFFIICSGLRLARFNTTKFYNKKEIKQWENDYSKGVPAPAGAIIAVLPIILSFAIHNPNIVNTENLAISFFLSAFFMVSNIRTFVFKNFKIKPPYISIGIIAIVFFIIFSVTKIWLTMSLMTIIYIASMPISHYKYRKKIKTS